MELEFLCRRFCGEVGLYAEVEFDAEVVFCVQVEFYVKMKFCLEEDKQTKYRRTIKCLPH